MKKTLRRCGCLVLAILLVLSVYVTAWAQDDTDSFEMSDDTRALREAAQQILECESGKFPEDAFSICEQLLEIDPELAKKALDHMESMAIPIESVLENIPDDMDTYRDSSDALDRPGMYVKDGDGGRYVYFNEDDLVDETSSEDADTNIENALEPFNYNDYDAIVDPRYNTHGNSVCKIYTMYAGRPFYGSGFFVKDNVVATAAHVLWNISWTGTPNERAWADSIYIKQAYAPKSTTSKEPYGILFGELSDDKATVGASWESRNSDDDDWGAFLVKGSIGGTAAYSYRPKKQIDVNSYIGKSITIYGYPQPDPNIENSMFRVKGKAVEKPSDRSTYRVLYGGDTSGGSADGWHGMSGGPVLDTNGNVIAIFIGKTDAALSRSKSVSLDKWLYPVLRDIQF